MPATRHIKPKQQPKKKEVKWIHVSLIWGNGYVRIFYALQVGTFTFHQEKWLPNVTENNMI